MKYDTFSGKLADLDACYKPLGRSASIEPQTQKYFIRMIMNDAYLKAQMLKEFKVRRKSCQCRDCKVKAVKGSELSDPLSAYLHISEIKVKLNVLEKFRKNVILALHQKREREKHEQMAFSMQALNKKKKPKPLLALLKS